MSMTTSLGNNNIGGNGPSFYTPQRETSYGKKFMNLGSQLVGGSGSNPTLSEPYRGNPENSYKPSDNNNNMR